MTKDLAGKPVTLADVERELGPKDTWGDAAKAVEARNAQPINDKINPRHCKSQSGIECIQITRFLSFSLGNAIKYVWRRHDKGTEIEDLQKAAWYFRDVYNYERKFSAPTQINHRATELAALVTNHSSCDLLLKMVLLRVLPPGSKGMPWSTRDASERCSDLAERMDEEVGLLRGISSAP